MNNINPTLFHQLKGNKICFKALDLRDLQSIHSFASDEDVSRFIGWNLMRTLNETREYIEEMLKREAAGTHLYASIVLVETQEIIGTAMIFNFDRAANHAEIGYVLHKDYWSKGYGTEAVILMNDFAFESLDLHKLHARVVDANTGSIRVLEKACFELEGRLKDYHFIEGRFYDGLIFGKVRS